MSHRFIKEKGYFNIVLSGGRYSYLCTKYLTVVCVIGIPEANVFAINDKLSAEAAADDCEARIGKLVESKKLRILKTTRFLKFDIVSFWACWFSPTGTPIVGLKVSKPFKSNDIYLDEFPRQAEQVPCATTYPKGESPGSSWATNGHHPTRVSPGVVSLGCRERLYGCSPR
ncbi:hypothetical protein LguiA_022005 [Lonicera macranthoides]